MYVGRFVIIGPDVGAYRVSSRSYPNRKIVQRGERLTVVPTDGAPRTDNPYISYNCFRPENGYGILGNGSHVDPIAEKIGVGYPPRDALVESLIALDYERDDYDTPRLAGVVGGESYVGIVRRDALLVERVAEPTLVATYERDRPEPFAFGASEASEAAHEAYALEFDHPVCALGVVRTEDGVRTAIQNG